VGRGEQGPAVLSVFGTGFFGCYLWGDGNSDNHMYVCIALCVYCSFVWLTMYICTYSILSLAMCIALCGWPCVELCVGGHV